MRFEWDENKNQANIIKHGIDFQSASLVFLDEDYVEVYDSRNSANEDRFVIIGMMENTTVILYVCYTERKDAIRIISARKAAAKEREGYFNGYYQI